MKIKSILFALFSFSFVTSNAAEIRYSGGDISLLPTYEASGVIYNDTGGKQIELLPYLYDLGMNAMRVRLFVDPAAFEALYPNDYDPNACQSLPYIIPLCQDIVNNGFDLMLDFHYSDTWADPGDQWIPNAWKNLTDAQLVDKIYEYTSATLQTLKENGVIPKFIQPGNEISYGMLWSEYGKDITGNHVYQNSSSASWNRFGDFLRSAIKACRENCPDTEIIIHTERVAQVGVLTNFYNKMASLNIDYDIIGLSYYPAYHGNLSQLNTALSSLETQFPQKPIMIVETGYPLYWDIPDTQYSPEFGKGSEKEQNEYAKSLVNILLEHPNVNGLFWWWLEYNPYGADLSNWYNAPLFDPYTGKPTAALKTIASFATDNANIDTIDSDSLDSENRWYDINGIRIGRPIKPGIYIHNGKKIAVK